MRACSSNTMDPDRISCCSHVESSSTRKSRENQLISVAALLLHPAKARLNPSTGKTSGSIINLIRPRKPVKSIPGEREPLSKYACAYVAFNWEALTLLAKSTKLKRSKVLRAHLRFAKIVLHQPKFNALTSNPSNFTLRLLASKLIPLKNWVAFNLMIFETYHLKNAMTFLTNLELPSKLVAGLPWTSAKETPIN